MPGSGSREPGARWTPLPGGPLEIEWDGEGEVLMTGPAALVFEGEWPE